MSTSYIEYAGRGFWSFDPHTEDLINEAVTFIEQQPQQEEWLTELAAHWRLQASGTFAAWMHLNLDKFLIDEPRRNRVRQILQGILERHAPQDVVHQTAVLMLQLINGKLTTDAASPLDYMVQGPKRG
jgi:hypothetical protein